MAQSFQFFTIELSSIEKYLSTKQYNTSIKIKHKLAVGAVDHADLKNIYKISLKKMNFKKKSCPRIFLTPLPGFLMVRPELVYSHCRMRSCAQAL